MLTVILATFALLALFVYLSTSPAITKTKSETNRFYEVAIKHTHLLDALREAPDFHGIYFGTCAHIEKVGSSGEESPIVFIPKVGERTKFRTVRDALERNTTMLRDFEACRQASVVYMKIFPYRGVVAVELDERGSIKKIQEPFFSN